VFSVPLFLIAINDITKCVHFPFSQRLFADDYNISLQSADPLRAHRLIQKTLDVISNWTTTKGYRFSSFKTTLVIFKKKRNPTPSLPPLILQNFRIKTNDLIKFLGLTLHRTSNWIHHIKSLKAKCLWSLNEIFIAPIQRLQSETPYPSVRKPHSLTIGLWGPNLQAC